MEPFLRYHPARHHSWVKLQANRASPSVPIKVPGIRAALAHSVVTAQLAREHNNANVLALGARIVTPAAALEMVEAFLNTPFAGGRHQLRLDKISAIEKEKHDPGT